MFINSPIHRFTSSPTGDSPNCSVSSDSPIHQFTDSPTGNSPKSSVSSDSPIHRFTDSPIDGVTLVELIIVLAIIGIIVLFATIDTAWFQRDARVSEARDRLLADVEEAKLKSITNVPHAIFVVGAATSYTVRKLPDTDANFKRDTTETASIEIVSTSSLSTNVKVRLTGGDELWFDRKGVPRTSTWRIGNCSVTTATLCDEDSDCPGESCIRTFTVWYDANGNGSVDADEPNKTITISSGGRVKYEQ